jgi:hypothetical protein
VSLVTESNTTSALVDLITYDILELSNIVQTKRYGADMLDGKSTTASTPLSFIHLGQMSGPNISSVDEVMVRLVRK